MRSAARSTTSPTIPARATPRRARLARWRADIDALYRRRAAAAACRPGAGGARLRSRSARIFSPSSTAWRWTSSPISARPTSATLDLYCDRVACAVGRLSVRVFGMERDAGLALAHHLGRALQLTNILRDLDEDAAIGRLYLPREALRGAGIISTDPAAVLAQSDARRGLRRRSSSWRKRTFASAARSWRKARAASCARRGSWARPIGLILDRLVARGFAPPRPPVRLPRRGSCSSCCAILRVSMAERSTSSAPASPACPPRCKLTAARRARGRARGDGVRRRPLPLLSRCLARHDDRQRQSSVAVGQSRRARLSAQHRRRASPGRPAGGGILRLSISPAASAGRCASTTAACRSGFSIPAGACRERARSIICRWRGSCGRRRARRSARSSPATGRSIGGWSSRCCWRRSISIRRTDRRKLAAR